jgi:hypothetical protein
MSVDHGLEKVLRATLGDQFKRYGQFNVVNSRETSHADVHHITLSRTKRAHFALKHFKPVLLTDDLAYAHKHSPDRLVAWEAKIFHWLASKVKTVGDDGKEKKPLLVPSYYGHSLDHRALTTQFICGDNLSSLLLAATSTEFEKIFLGGLVDVARLNGISNAEGNKLYSNGAEFNLQGKLSKREEFEGLKTNLARINYSLTNQPGSTTFSVNLIEQQLRGKGIDLDSRLRELKEMSGALNEPLSVQHNDCNGNNMVVPPDRRFSTRFVDLENFGVNGSTADPSSYCIVLGRSNSSNHVFGLDSFPQLRYVYHAFEHAYRSQDPDLVKHLQGHLSTYQECNSFKNYVGNILTQREDADLTLAFFDRAIKKTIKLSAAAARHQDFTDSTHDPIADSKQANWKEDMNGLFRTVSGLSQVVNDCTDPEGVRNYFYTLGETLNDVGYSIPSGLLDEIKSGSVGARIVASRPDQYRKEG